LWLNPDLGLTKVKWLCVRVKPRETRSSRSWNENFIVINGGLIYCHKMDNPINETVGACNFLANWIFKLAGSQSAARSRSHSRSPKNPARIFIWSPLVLLIADWTRDRSQLHHAAFDITLIESWEPLLAQHIFASGRFRLHRTARCRFNHQLRVIKFHPRRWNWTCVTPLTYCK